MKHLFRTLALLLALLPCTAAAQQPDASDLAADSSTTIGWTDGETFVFYDQAIYKDQTEWPREHVRLLLNNKFFELFELTDAYPTPLQQKRYLESPEGAENKRTFDTMRRALLTTTFAIAADVTEPYDLEKKNFRIPITCDGIVFVTDDPKFEGKWYTTKTFTTGEIDEDTAYKIETRPTMALTYVKLQDAPDGYDFRATPLVVLLADKETAEIYYRYTVGGEEENESAAAPEAPATLVDRREVPPTYPGGEAALLRDLNSGIIYPPIAAENGIQGTVVLRFTVKADGTIAAPQVVRSLSPECDAAALKALKKLKRFSPAMQGGRPCATPLTIPVRFRLQ